MGLLEIVLSSCELLCKVGHNQLTVIAADLFHYWLEIQLQQ